MNVDPEDLVNVPGVDHESKVHTLARVLLLEEGGPLAEELLAAPLTGPWEARRAFLKTTLAWISRRPTGVRR